MRFFAFFFSFKRDLVKNFNYGKGCYFAQSPMLSIRSEYAKLDQDQDPEKFNTQTVILALVAVGDVIAGTKDMRQPPVKDENLLRYENTVDRIQLTQIYVAYDDHQVIDSHFIRCNLVCLELSLLGSHCASQIDDNVTFTVIQ